jgi:hypothetical protein
MLTLGQQPFSQLAKNIFDGHAIFSAQGAFPDDAAAPSGNLQGGFRTGVRLAIAGDFRFPEFLAGLGPFEEMAVVPMPETSMRKQNGAATPKYHVRFAGQSPVMKPETKACPMQTAAQDQFGLCIRAPDTSHHAAADFRRYDINHAR